MYYNAIKYLSKTHVPLLSSAQPPCRLTTPTSWNWRRVPMRRMGQVEDVAGIAAFLAGDGAGYVTGTVIAVDGGMSM